MEHSISHTHLITESVFQESHNTAFRKADLALSNNKQWQERCHYFLWTGHLLSHESGQTQKWTWFSYHHNDFSLGSPSEMWGIIILLCFPGLGFFFSFLILWLCCILITKTGSQSKWPGFKITGALAAWMKRWRKHEPDATQNVFTSPVSRPLW